MSSSIDLFQKVIPALNDWHSAIECYHFHMETEKTTRQTVLKFLERHVKMILSINEAGKAPNTVLMHFAINQGLQLYFGTKRSSAKYAALKRDPKVSFLVIDEGLDPKCVASGRGDARELNWEDTKAAYAFFKSANRSKWYMEGEKDLVMFEVILNSLCWLDGSSGDIKICDINIALNA